MEIKDYIKEKSMKDNLNDDEIKTLNIIGMSAFNTYTCTGCFQISTDTIRGKQKIPVKIFLFLYKSGFGTIFPH